VKTALLRSDRKGDNPTLVPKTVDNLELIKKIYTGLWKLVFTDGLRPQFLRFPARKLAVSNGQHLQARKGLRVNLWRLAGTRMLRTLPKATCIDLGDFSRSAAGRCVQTVGTCFQTPADAVFLLGRPGTGRFSPAVLTLLFLYFKLVGVVEQAVLCGQAGFLLANQGLGVRTSV
jgi:hypothetical protein